MSLKQVSFRDVCLKSLKLQMRKTLVDLSSATLGVRLVVCEAKMSPSFFTLFYLLIHKPKYSSCPRFSTCSSCFSL